MNLFNVQGTNPDGTVRVECPKCGAIFNENDTADAVAGCPQCNAMGYLNHPEDTNG